MANRHPRSPYHYGALDRVIRRRDSVRGQVVYAETLYAVVAWEDGVNEVIDQFGRAAMVEVRGALEGGPSSELQARLAGLQDELDDVEWEIEEAERRRSRLEDEISEIESALEGAKEAEALLAMQAAQAVQLLAAVTEVVNA